MITIYREFPRTGHVSSIHFKSELMRTRSAVKRQRARPV